MIFAVIVLVGVAAFLPKFVSLTVRTKREPSKRAKQLLSYAPVAILAALVVPMVFTSGGPRLVDVVPYLVGAAAVALASILTKRLLLAAAIGIVIFYLLRLVTPW